jgi:hypothetical protein
MRTLALLVILAPGGCKSFGPDAVWEERPSYNEAIHETAKEQTFLNIIRVRHHDTTFFMDVSEVDASLQIQGQGTTGLSFPQALGMGGGYYAGHDYTIGGSLQFQESPTIRFQPLTGAALIAQVASPITVDSLASLYDSDWPIGPLLDLATDRIAPRLEDNYPALNAIMELDSYGALVLAAIKSPISIDPGGNGGQSTAPRAIFLIQSGTGRSESGSATPTSNDTLAIFFEPERVLPHEGSDRNAALQATAQLWARLLRIYRETLKPEDQTALPEALNVLDSGKFDPQKDTIPRVIELRTTPVDPTKVVGASRQMDLAPILRTHSALGVLRSATNELPRFSFVDESDLDCKAQTRLEEANSQIDSYFYVVPHSGKITDFNVAPFASSDPRFHLDLDVDAAADLQTVSSQQVAYLQDERELANSRQYIVVIEGYKSPPSTAFVSTKMEVFVVVDGQLAKKTRYFYIDGADRISQRNFALINQFLTMQAIPSQTPPITPSISVGGHGS